jgi:Domain of unknown function (DUF4440)
VNQVGKTGKMTMVTLGSNQVPITIGNGAHFWNVLRWIFLGASSMRFAVCLCLCLGLTVLAYGADPAGADHSKIIALENAWNQAQLHHDSKALDSLVADTFVYTDYDGTVMNKAQFLADIKDPDYKASLVANENEKVFAYQGTAIVVGTYHTKGTYKGKAFEHHGRFTDTWIYQDGHWQCVASHTTLLNK